MPYGYKFDAAMGKAINPRLNP